MNALRTRTTVWDRRTILEDKLRAGSLRVSVVKVGRLLGFEYLDPTPAFLKSAGNQTALAVRATARLRDDERILIVTRLTQIILLRRLVIFGTLESVQVARLRAKSGAIQLGSTTQASDVAIVLDLDWGITGLEAYAHYLVNSVLDRARPELLQSGTCRCHLTTSDGRRLSSSVIQLVDSLLLRNHFAAEVIATLKREHIYLGGLAKRALPRHCV